MLNLPIFSITVKPPFRQVSSPMARRFAARHRARDDMICCPPQSGGHHLNGADTAPFGRGRAPLAPLVGQKMTL